jgi:hypothetical protein
MSFKPFEYKYVPPKTVPQPSRVDVDALPSSDSFSESAKGSNAGKLIAGLEEMAETSIYLQTAIVERMRNTGVEIDLSAEPDVAIALTRIYGTDTPPSVITIPMFNNLLDAEAGMLQLDMQLDEGSLVEVNPIQHADVSLVTKRVEDLLIDSGEYRNQLPVLLRSLKGDVVVYRNWNRDLRSYPAVGVITPTDFIRNALHKPGPIDQALIATRRMDISDGLYSTMTSWMNRYSSIYSSVYQMMSTVNHIERGISHVAEAFILQPVQDIVRVISLLNGLKGLFHKGALKNIADSLTDFVFARMAADVGGFMFLIDRFVRMAVDPIRHATGKLGMLLGSVNRITNQIGQIASGGLKGMTAGNACSQKPHSNHGSNKRIDVPGLGAGDALPEALKTLGDHLSWSTRLAGQQRDTVDESFRKLTERRLKDQADRIDTMCSLQSLDSLLAIAQGFVNETQRGTSFSSSNQIQQSEAVGRILVSLKTGSDTVFAIQDGEIVITPPDMPEPSEQVEKVLRQGGLDRITRGDMVHINGVLNG